MPPGLVQLYTYQASRALAHLHASGVVHRDIKPQNMLVDASRGHLLKLCDFGSAAQLSRGKATLVAYICSRYYRAPELIFGAMNYTSAVDLWSIGCVLGEMLRGRRHPVPQTPITRMRPVRLHESGAGGVRSTASSLMGFVAKRGHRQATSLLSALHGRHFLGGRARAALSPRAGGAAGGGGLSYIQHAASCHHPCATPRSGQRRCVHRGCEYGRPAGWPPRLPGGRACVSRVLF